MKLTRGIVALILQYKVPERKDTYRAKFYSFHHQQYYQIKLWPDNRSHQHNILVNLATDPRNHVYYCTPAFVSKNEFEAFYRSKSIQANSMFINCRGLSYISGWDRHYITYSLSPHVSYMHSYPEEAGMISGDMLGERLIEGYKYDTFENCIETINEVMEVRFPRHLETVAQKLNYLAETMMVRYGLCLYLHT